ncbi:MAG TPA: hypothetical protein VHF25_12170 [Nitriliruptorales bacterium]|nr:hypothetical protein [Nitriliruptorales bacterium]
MSEYQELPAAAQRERRSARALPADAAAVPTPPATPAGDSDLEQRMKRILDEAARRHGIEV